MVIDPLARSTDGESVRIAKDVLCAGAGAKICLPEGPEEFARILARRGQRRPVVIGDDRALLRVVGLLHKQRELAEVPVSVVPVGAPASVALSRALGVPTDTVAAARAVLDGGARPMDLLVDDSGGIVLGGLRIPCGSDGRVSDGRGGDDRGSGHGSGRSNRGGGRRPRNGAVVPGAAGPADDLDPAGPVDPMDPVGPAGGDGSGSAGGAGSAGDVFAGRGGREGAAAGLGGGHQPWWRPAARTARTALSLLAPAAGRWGSPRQSGAEGGGGRRARVRDQRLRIEADGVVLADLDRPVRGVSVVPAGADRGGREGPEGRHGPQDGRDGPPDGQDGLDGRLAEVVVHWPGEGQPVRTRARAVTVSGADFHYRADAVVGGPVRTRTWTVQPGAWHLQLPRDQG
ncbi:hypothetical protein [Streptomyces sp. NBRC 110611]|uniref:hypothetical protein n=1 Tax=Streptomyces sp. NBRC 110611 TaxID=1621259 RepID=UPI00215C2FD6|nr:hypothetical protein [Streptomyces sp. NBRC 110611]